MKKLMIIKPKYGTEKPDTINQAIVQYLVEKYPDIVNREEFEIGPGCYTGIGVMEDKKRWNGKILTVFVFRLETFERYMTKVYDIVEWGWECNLKTILEEE